MNDPSFISQRLQAVSAPARKLFAIIVDQVHRDPLRPKPEGVATPPQILEACGLDLGEFYALLGVLQEAGLIEVSSSYPFEEIQLTPEAHSECVVRNQEKQRNLS